MKHLIVTTAATVALTAPFAQTATGHDTDIAAVHRGAASWLVHYHPAPATTCYKQLANDNGNAIDSQNFEAGFDQYDSRGADDFTLTRRCTISEVDVNGLYFGGSGPAASIDVRFYLSRRSGGPSGGAVHRRPEQFYTDPSGTGNFQVVLSKPVTFRPGHYWVSVRVNMDAGAGGEWGWGTNNTVNGKDSQWRNPGDGFGTGCVTFTRTWACVGPDAGHDFAFALLK